MAKAEQYAQWIVANQNKKGTPEFETVAAAYREAKQLEAGDTAAQRKEAREAGARLPTGVKATLQGLRGATLGFIDELAGAGAAAGMAGAYSGAGYAGQPAPTMRPDQAGMLAKEAVRGGLEQFEAEQPGAAMATEIFG